MLFWTPQYQFMLISNRTNLFYDMLSFLKEVIWYIFFVFELLL